MTSKRISEQINTIRAAAEKASVSPESALAFLRSAGIITGTEEVIGSAKKNGVSDKANDSYQHSVNNSSKAVPVKSGLARTHRVVAKKS